ncbi:phosphatidylethanolamine-binding protein [Russula emetica]|nr:phosphatidylethanolamine-binding protein [Russula emetica]
MIFTSLALLSGMVLFSSAAPCSPPAPIEADFKTSNVVPDLLSSFNPSATMNVAFPGVGLISPGQNLSMQQVATAPNVTITPANSSVPTTGNFTLMMVDAAAIGTNDSNGVVLHWLANSATLKTSSSACPSLNVSTDGGLVVTNYVSPAPPVGTGVHRYVILLFPQPSSFSPPANQSSPDLGVDIDFQFTEYISSSHLPQPIAGMFFEVPSAAK